MCFVIVNGIGVWFGYEYIVLKKKKRIPECCVGRSPHKLVCGSASDRYCTMYKFVSIVNRIKLMDFIDLTMEKKCLHDTTLLDSTS